MPELTEHQLKRLQSAAEEIQRVLSEIETPNVGEPAPAIVIRRAAVSVVSSAGTITAEDDIIVVGEPE